jgi:xylono-1,5-lactonase
VSGEAGKYLFETLAFGYGLVEAPRVDGEGNVFFSDVLGGGVHRWSPDGSVTMVVPKRRGVGGMLFHADGGLVVSGRDLVHVRDGETNPLLALEDVAGFNDMTSDAQGRVYIGALKFRPFAGESPVPGAIWRVERGGAASELLTGIDWPNGIGFSPDGGTVYASDYARGEVIAYDLSEDGSPSSRRVFARSPEGSADRLAVDRQGGVWVAMGEGGAVARFAADGSLDSLLEAPAPFVSSVCFGGEEMRELYVTTAGNSEAMERGGTLFRARVDVAGLPVGMAAV